MKTVSKFEIDNLTRMAKTIHSNILNSSQGTAATYFHFKTNCNKQSISILTLKWAEKSFAPKGNMIGHVDAWFWRFPRLTWYALQKKSKSYVR